jgi:hypothetical protein
MFVFAITSRPARGQTHFYIHLVPDIFFPLEAVGCSVKLITSISCRGTECVEFYSVMRRDSDNFASTSPFYEQAHWCVKSLNL